MSIKVLLVADNCSTKMGGEAILPYHYYRILVKKNVNVTLLVHERNRNELIEYFGKENQNIVYVADTILQKWCWKIGCKIPKKIADATLFSISFLSANFRMKSIAKKIVKEKKIDVIHQVTPVSPKAPSFLYGVGAAVIIGPMNGGMEYPKFFRKKISFIETIFHRIGKKMGKILNFLIPGKRKAVFLLASNSRTIDTLKEAVNHKKVFLLSENGVDLKLWDTDVAVSYDNEEIMYTYVGRLVDWKRVDLLIKAYSKLNNNRIKINIIGDGEEKENLINVAKRLNIESKINFTGFMEQNKIVEIIKQSRALVLPSIYECGGAVVLEAMALKKPVIAVNWGGPAEYLDKESGILINPESDEKIIDGFAEAMNKLADDKALSEKMGIVGRKKIEKEFDWDKKAEKMIEYYKLAIKG